MPDISAIFDPTLPTISIPCPECDYNQAIYFLMPDKDERRMVTKLMCKSRTGSTIKCGHVWELPENSEITNSTLRVKEEEEGVSEFNDFGSKYK